MSKAKKNILFAALAALALTVCLVGVTGAYFIAQASRTNTLTVGEVTFDPKEDIQNPDVPVQPGNSFMKRPYVVRRCCPRRQLHCSDHFRQLFRLLRQFC